MNEVFLRFYLDKTMAFEIDCIKDNISRNGSQWVFDEFSKWLDEYIESGSDNVEISASYLTIKNELLNNNWCMDARAISEELYEFRELVVNKYLYEFVAMINAVARQIGLDKKGFLKGYYFREEYDFGTDSIKTPTISYDYEVSIPANLLSISETLPQESNPFAIKINDLKQYFTLENALQIARERILSDKQYAGNTGQLKQSLKIEFMSQLELINSKNLRGLEDSLRDVGYTSNICQFLEALVKDKTIYGHLKTPENLKGVIYEAVLSRLEYPCNEIKLNSFSMITETKQPKDTCPMIDGNFGQTDTEDIECEIRSIRYDIEGLKGDISQLEESKYDLSEMYEDENDEEERVRGIDKKISEIEDSISNLEGDISDKEDDIKELGELVRFEAELLREACSETRSEISTYRDHLYEYYKGMVYEFNDNKKCYLVIHPRLESHGRRPDEYEELWNFDRCFLEKHGFREAIKNYDLICGWGSSLADLDDNIIYELCEDALEFDSLIDQLVEEALCYLDKGEDIAS